MSLCVGEEGVVMGAQVLACAFARVALLIQLATRRNIVICGFSGPTLSFDIIS
jgi:hypothetical protein